MTRTTWNKPLLVLAVTMVVVAVGCAVAMTVDHRQITGVDAWQKPFKFAVSIALYSFTWSWLTSLLVRRRALVNIAAWVATATLTIEMVIIVGAAAAGTTSHFNVSTPLATALWGTMAASITVLYLATFVVTILLFRVQFGDRARTVALRAGAIIALVGMGLGFLMTSPTASQLEDFHGIAGAHTVGAPDGGPGLPLLGWSTVAGDLRIPHFIGMHALQLIPLFALLLEVVARFVPVLREPRIRLRLVWVAVGVMGAIVALVSWQALIGQSIVHPAGPILVAGIAVAVAAVLAVAIVLLADRLRRMPPASRTPLRVGTPR